MARNRPKQLDPGKSRIKHRRYQFLAILGSLALAAVTAAVVNLVNKGTDKIVSPNGPALVSYSSAPLETACGVVTFLPEPIAHRVLYQLVPQHFTAIENQPGAAPAGAAVVEASIQGGSARAITITRISFKVHRKPRPPGATFTQACGGPLIGRAVEVDLDASPPRIIGTNAVPGAFLGEGREGVNNEPLKIRPITFPWTVSLTEPLQLYLIATTRTCYCGWQAELRWVSGAARGTILISNHGRNYLVAGPNGVQGYLGGAGGTWHSITDNRPPPLGAVG